MQKAYLLLRNNRQLGPYSLDELLQQSLQPFDLVWVEGKSAGWVYPSELNELKTLVAEPTGGHKSITGSSATIPTEKSKELKKGHVYVSMPFGTRGNVLHDAAAKKERGTQQAAALQASTNEASESEIKYSRSLDDIKEEYANWLYEQKTGKNKRPKNHRLYLAAALIIVLIGATSVFVFSKTRQKEAVPASSLADAVPGNIEATEASFARSSSKKKSVSRKPARVHSTAKAKAPSKNSNTNLARLVSISGSYVKGSQKGIPEFGITVHNNSREYLHMVSVDVLYYKKNGSIAATKTLYFYNLPPLQSMSRTAPSNRKAEEARYHLVLVSRKNNEMYLAADNK